MRSADAIDRLTEANPLPDGLPAPPLEAVLRRLDEDPHAHSAQPGAAASGTRRNRSATAALRRHASRSAVPVVASLVAIAVVAAALVLPGRRAAVPQRHMTGAFLPTAPLLPQFAILRRAQTARDRSIPSVVRSMLRSQPQGRRLLPGLTRVVGRLPSRGQGAPLLLVVAHGTSAKRPTDVWLLAAVTQSDGAGGAGGSPYAPDQLFPQIGEGYAEQLVPDAVTRVKWVFPHRTVYPKIRDNVATASAAVPRGSGPGLASVTWYGRDGRVLAYETAAMLAQREAASQKRVIATEVAASLLAGFPILHRRETAADMLPERLSQMARRDRSLAPWLSQRVDVPGAKVAQWLVPGRHGLCRFVAPRLPNGGVQAAAAAEYCEPATGLVAHAVTVDVSNASGSPGQPATKPSGLATAVFPRTVSAVTLVRSDGTTANVPLAQGFMAVALAAGDRLYAIERGRRRLLPATAESTPTRLAKPGG